ncbi:GntR family transcriptional regulator, histidine utilization repressor [Cohaesibacter sp. ES.047]|uniref:GntR family transcriptional regulator n=1 Tax=Cohaesibacter sp. ES.047 TaxID=1798205 RepID=UPI000BBFDD17|nr:GntR family transcriptional regulator [Cohaesibacter sp. ES.047]SNY92616.1 GntR family transcriptional regulator, histidine utilization repressor [Cohaesibacter sp. ES.047]
MESQTAVKYLAIKELILERIKQKQWPPGSLLPTEIQLAEEFGCARATVNRALAQLAEDGIIDRRRKAGSRVNSLPQRSVRVNIVCAMREIEAKGTDYRYQQLRRSFGLAPEWLCDLVDLPKDIEMLYLQSLHFADDQPFQFQEAWLNATDYPEVVDMDFIKQDPFNWVLREMPFLDTTLYLKAQAAHKHVAKCLDIATGDPVLFRSYHGSWSSKTVCFFRRIYRSDYEMISQG